MLEEQKEIKIIFVGNANVGKTSIATRYVSGIFSNIIEPTVGAAFLSKEVELNSIKCTFNIWDTAGQESYRYLVPMYYRNAAIAVIVFDLTNETSFQAINSWVEDVKKSVENDIVLILCGNKCDIETKSIEFDQIQEISKKLELIYVQTSAATGEGINKLFEIALSEYIKTEKEISKLPITILNKEKIISKKKGCC